MLSAAKDGIRVAFEVPPMGSSRRNTGSDGASRARVAKLVDLLEQEVREQTREGSTLEERNDAALDVVKDVLWRREDNDLRSAVTLAAEVEVDGKRHVRLNQASSATYYGRWGSHDIEEPLYRELGAHNGPTIKPLELRSGMIGRHMTPDLARVMGELFADRSSREVERTMQVTGMVPPGRAFIEKRMKQVAGEIADDCATLEESAREATPVAKEIASVSCGLDRFSVRMSEPIEGEVAQLVAQWAANRTEPYQRTPPPPREYRYRKAWVGSTTTYDKAGNALDTWHYSVEPEGDPNALADRVATDVARVLEEHPTIPVHCIQDAAPELRAMPEALARALPSSANVRELVDFEHLAKYYLDKVVDACEPEGDPNKMKAWYREELLRDDHAIDRIWRNLRQKGKRLGRRNTAARDAIVTALRYIRSRRNKMRYASLYKANLPIGSGTTESTCWQMQRRVQRPGQSWEVPGLRGTLTIRSLVLSDRWSEAWKPYAARCRNDVHCVN